MGIITDKFGALENPPLVYTLLMLRFPTQTALRDRVTVIQESLKQVYPIYEKRVQQGIEVVKKPDGQTISTISTPEFLFFDSSRTKGVLIKEDRIIFHSSVYPSFSEFSSWFKSVAESVVDALSISHYLGCGIRYIDALAPDHDSGESLADYLHPSLLPFDMENESISKCIASNQNSKYRTNFGTVVFNSHILFEDDTCIPPDLRDLSSLLRFENEKKAAPFAVLDFDHGYAAPDGTAVSLDLDDLVTKIDGMHKVASHVFIKSINNHALRRGNND